MKIGWLLVGDERVASSRIQGLSIHRELLARGVRSEILTAPRSFDTRLHWKAPRRWFEATLRRRDILVFQKVESSRAARFARLARRLGTRIVFLQADVRESGFYRVADSVVVSSSELASQLAPFCRAPITVIEDAIDLPRETEAVPSRRRERLRVLWIGGRLNFPSLERIRPVLDQAEFRDLDLITVSDHPDAKLGWSRETALRELREADVAVLPCLDTPSARAKSNNRLTLFMGAGIPVVASPIPAYQAIVDHGENGFLAESSEKWAATLRALREPGLREAVGRAARLNAWGRYAPDVIAGHWQRHLDQLVAKRRRPVREAPPLAERRGVVRQDS